MPRGVFERKSYQVRVKQARIPKALVLIIENHIAIEKQFLREMKGGRVVSKVWHNQNQECYIKGMMNVLSMVKDIEAFDCTWLEGHGIIGSIDASKTHKLKV